MNSGIMFQQTSLAGLVVKDGSLLVATRILRGLFVDGENETDCTEKYGGMPMAAQDFNRAIAAKSGSNMIVPNFECSIQSYRMYQYFSNCS